MTLSCTLDLVPAFATPLVRDALAAEDRVDARDSWTDLYRELRGCQQRLGTADERPDDLTLARTLAHEINNRITLRYLKSAMADMDERASAASAVVVERMVA